MCCCMQCGCHSSGWSRHVLLYAVWLSFIRLVQTCVVVCSHSSEHVVVSIHPAGPDMCCCMQCGCHSSGWSRHCCCMSVWFVIHPAGPDMCCCMQCGLSFIRLVQTCLLYASVFVIHPGWSRHVLLYAVWLSFIRLVQTCVVVSTSPIVLGSTVRCLMVMRFFFSFRSEPALPFVLGSTATGAEYGAVSALSITHDCTRLLCGFAKGHITMWDLANGSFCEPLPTPHPPGTAILHVKFTDDPTLAVCNDSGGLMGMRTCESRCLFSGSKGEVCNVEPLLTAPDLKDHPITQYSLLAMASLTKILVIGLKPSLKVWMTFPLCVPQLAWQFVPVQKVVNPVLAFCRGDTVHFLLVKKDETGTIHVIKQRQLQLNCDIISLNWINSRTLVVMDSGEKLRVVDRPSQEELESLDVAEVQLVYNSSHFKSLATGGNVSQALALVGEKACYQSVCSYAGQMVLLGTKSAHILTLRNWRERVDCLLKQERFVEALSLAWSFHEGTAKAVLGLFGDPAKRKGVVADKMIEILFQYVERSVKKCPEHGKIQVMEQHFQDMVPVMVDYCLQLQRTDLLFNQLYTRLVENCVARGVFLESLEPYIVSERLGCVTAPVMRDLLTHLQDNNMMDSVENCLIHLDITSLDIQQVVQMCWDNQLYDAMIYVTTSPLWRFVYFCLTDEQVVMGNKLLVYISCSLAGRAYPLGDIPEDLVSQVKNQVFEFLIRLHSAEAGQEEELYPYIRTLVHFHTPEFLNVLALVSQQRIVDILLKVMVENSDFTPSQVGSLFTFLARQLAKPDNTLFVNRKLFDQVLEFLCSPDDDSRHTERQQVLLELLQVGGVVQFDEGRLLGLAEKAEFYQICEFLYEQKHLYDKILDCYLRDPLRKEEIFNYIHNLLSMPGYSSEEKHCVWEKALLHIAELVTLDPAKSADLVAIDDHLVFQFLRCLLDQREGPHPQPLLRLSPDLHELHIGLLCRFTPRQLTDFLKASQDYRLEEAVQVTSLHYSIAVCLYLSGLQSRGGRPGNISTLYEEEGETEREEESPLQRVEGSLGDIIALCHRSSQSLNQEQQGVCVCVFLCVSFSVCVCLSLLLKELTMKVLNSMSSFIPLPAIIQRILQDPVYGKGKLAEIQGLILGMLETFNYEQTLLETTTSLLNHDLHWSLSHLRAAVSRGLHPRQDHCNICLQQYRRSQDSPDDIIIFRSSPQHSHPHVSSPQHSHPRVFSTTTVMTSSYSGHHHNTHIHMCSLPPLS
uniref:VPS8 subunit of CORVET complex n=1 Tax=Oncorhynchus kisutch TaxID=8019 RepID=A0A8C7MJ04_ONCKI